MSDSQKEEIVKRLHDLLDEFYKLGLNPYAIQEIVWKAMLDHEEKIISEYDTTRIDPTGQLAKMLMSVVPKDRP
jgi:hypothetical protein